MYVFLFISTSKFGSNTCFHVYGISYIRKFVDNVSLNELQVFVKHVYSRYLCLEIYRSKFGSLK